MFSRIIADDPSRKNVYVEIYCKNVMIAEIIHENEINEIVIHNNPDGKWDQIPLIDFIEVLSKASADMVFP
ncbi:MAG: hypothetical protein ABIK45_10605 [Pseudomonadota bacterium]